METKDFKTDNNLIYHLIDSQKTDFNSALNELIQNSFDAGATECRICLDEKNRSFRITDNGAGFKNIEEIDSFFGTFGTAHTEDNSKLFGRFRLGRSQIFSLAKTLWKSNNFNLVVDIKNNGLTYDVLDDDTSTVGCIIEGTIYQGKERLCLNSLKNELQHKYFFLQRMKIFINDELFNNTKEFFKENEYLEFDDFYYFPNFYYSSALGRWKPSGLDIYNLGIYTLNYPGFPKLNGSIVSKTHLPLDISRKQIIENDECWLKIQKILLALSKKVKMSIKDIIPEDFFYSLFLGNIDGDELCCAKIFTEIQKGKTYSIYDLIRLNKKIAFVSYERNTEEYKIHLDNFKRRYKNQYVLIEWIPLGLGYKKFKNLESFDFEFTIDSFKSKILEIPASDTSSVFFQQFLKLFASDKKIDSLLIREENVDSLLKEKDLTLSEKIILKILNDCNNYISGGEKPRTIYLGISLNNNAWTDGSSYIVLNKNLTKSFNRNKEKLINIALVLVHEYTHEYSSCSLHDLDFFESFHDLLLHNEKLKIHKFIDCFWKAYAAELIAANLALPAFLTPEDFEKKYVSLEKEHFNLVSSNKILEKNSQILASYLTVFGNFTFDLLNNDLFTKEQKVFFEKNVTDLFRKAKGNHYKNNHWSATFSNALEPYLKGRFNINLLDIKLITGSYTWSSETKPLLEIYKENNVLILKILPIYEFNGLVFPLKMENDISSVANTINYYSIDRDIKLKKFYSFESNFIHENIRYSLSVKIADKNIFQETKYIWIQNDVEKIAEEPAAISFNYQSSVIDKDLPSNHFDLSSELDFCFEMRTPLHKL